MTRPVLAAAVAVGLLFVGATTTLALVWAEGGGVCAAARQGSGEARAVLACLSPSLAFVETDLGSGSGILIEGGYVITNAHVVEPLATADLVFDGGERYDDVPVAGADFAADIALLGPVDTDRRQVPIADFTGAQGDDVFLVGFPGEIDEEPEATISRGILSRTRRAADFDLTFLQTDASIGGGQSGGALVDGRNRLIGISGFSFAEQFALALSGADARASAAAILAGDVPEYRAFPETGETAGTFTVPDPESPQVLTVHTGDEPQVVRLSLPVETRPAVLVTGWMGDVYFQNQAAIDLTTPPGEVSFGPPEEADAPVAPGVFEFEIPEQTYAVLFVGSERPGPVQMRYTSSVPLGRYDDTDDDRPVRIGRTLTGVLDSLEARGDSFLLDLQEGDTVEIRAASATGDVGYTVRAPGGSPEDDVFVDDSDEGLFGVDARDTFTAERSGQHRIVVYSADGAATAYRLRVDRA